MKKSKLKKQKFQKHIDNDNKGVEEGVRAG